jgi:hypothetical protein
VTNSEFKAWGKQLAKYPTTFSLKNQINNNKQLYNISKANSQNKKVRNRTSTHFAKQKLEQKQNSLHFKNFKVHQITLQLHQNKN